MNHKIIWGLLLITMSCVQNQDFDAEIASLLDGDVPVIHTDSLKRKMTSTPELVLLDARTFAEYEVSHLPGAIFVGYDPFLKKKVALYEKDRLIVVYCSVGYRSEKVGRKLRKMGYTRIFNFYGGIFDWKNKGNIVVNANGMETDSVHTYNKSWSRWLKKGIKVQ